MREEQSKVADISLKQPMLIVFYTVIILLSIGITSLAFAGNLPFIFS